MSRFFNNNLNFIRKKKNITQQELADKTNIERSTISRIENGEIDTSIDNAIKIASALEIPLEEIIAKDLRFDNISPVEIDKDVIKIPVLGVIPAGIPIEAIEDVLDYEEIPKDWCKDGKEFFGLLIKGDSMFPKYIDNDVVIFEKTNDFNNGDECAVMVNGDDCTFKKVLKHDHGITLQPLNSAYDIKMYSNEDIEKLPIKIIGVAKEMRRKL
mgnify:FL=1|jgi:XRE family transcriptional regulator